MDERLKRNFQNDLDNQTMSRSKANKSKYNDLYEMNDLSSSREYYRRQSRVSTILGQDSLTEDKPKVEYQKLTRSKLFDVKSVDDFIAEEKNNYDRSENRRYHQFDTLRINSNKLDQSIEFNESNLINEVQNTQSNKSIDKEEEKMIQDLIENINSNEKLNINDSISQLVSNSYNNENLTDDQLNTSTNLEETLGLDDDLFDITSTFSIEGLSEIESSLKANNRLIRLLILIFVLSLTMVGYLILIK